MKYCTKCGAELEPNADICGSCGCPVPGAAHSGKTVKGLPNFRVILGIFAAVIVLCVISLANAPAAQPIPTESISFGNFTTVGFTIPNPRKAQAAIDQLRREFDSEHDRMIRMPSDPSVSIGNLEINGLLKYKSEYQTRFDDFTEELADWANYEVERSNNRLYAVGSTAFLRSPLPLRL